MLFHFFLIGKFAAEKSPISLMVILLKEVEHLLFSAFFHKFIIVYMVIRVKCQLNSLLNQLGHGPPGVSVRNYPDAGFECECPPWAHLFAHMTLN